MAQKPDTNACDTRVTLDGFLIAHGTALILPLAVIEGPFVSIATGFLAARGYFNGVLAFCLLATGDVVGDVLYYWVGRSGTAPLATVLRWIGVRATVPAKMQARLKANATRMLLIGKWTQSAGLVVLIGSGMLRISLPRFVLVNALATLPKTAVLMGIGAIAGEHVAVLEDHTTLTAIVLGVIGVAAIIVVLRRADGMRAGE
jgi:membrane protein DedA with SNARE-associated domain